MRVEAVGLVRYEADKTDTYLAVSAEADAPVELPVYGLPTEGHTVTALVFRTGQPARVDDYTKATGGEFVRRFREAGFGRPWVSPSRFENRCGGCLVSTRCTSLYPRIRRHVSRTSPR